jgi:exodeoxyribonuclease V alpha subunit
VSFRGVEPETGATRVRTLSELRLPPNAPCWAMSVHKSQGSEFDTVLVALPERISPLLTREMLYTAITRARKRVVVWGAREVIARCVERRIERRSGLRDRLWPLDG